MKATTALLLAAVLLTVPASGQSVQLTAYQALRTVGREKGESWLDRLVELRGVDGGPQPVRWLLRTPDKKSIDAVADAHRSIGGGIPRPLTPTADVADQSPTLHPTVAE